MEIILAIVVATAVIFFGALISTGNERHRKAIDGLREQVELWAIQDLKIKREILMHEVRVDNPLDWLNKIATKVSGMQLNLQIADSFDEPDTLFCISENQDTKVLISPSSLKEIKRIGRKRRSRLSQIGNNNPLMSLPNNVSIYEVSVLNAGILFDLELKLAWKGFTGKNIGRIEKLWLYVV